MAKRRFQLTEAEEKEIKIAYEQCKDAATSKKLLGVRLYGIGQPVATILDLVGCSRSSLMNWCQQYQEAGMSNLVDKRRGGNHYKLNPSQKAELSEKLHRYTPRQVLGMATATASGEHWTSKDVRVVVQKWYDVVYQSPNSYWLLLRECGLSYQRTEKIFKSRKVTKVADFEEQLEKN